jgi:RHS repeat-associated protein
VFAGVTRCVTAVEARSWYAYESTGSASLEWYGTVVGGKRDATGTMYRRARYYDPQTGRFTQEDPIGLAGGLNLYGYAGGDPVNHADPSGLCPWCAVGAVVGAVSGAAIYHFTTPPNERTAGGYAAWTIGGAVAGGTFTYGGTVLAAWVTRTSATVLPMGSSTMAATAAAVERASKLCRRPHDCVEMATQVADDLGGQVITFVPKVGNALDLLPGVSAHPWSHHAVVRLVDGRIVDPLRNLVYSSTAEYVAGTFKGAVRIMINGAIQP